MVKRYFFSGQAVAMRRDEELLFLRPDHLGSASLLLAEDGRWLADHRFYPYGEAVTTTYNARGLPETLEAGTQTLVEGAAYTALGQPALVQYGGAGLNLQTTYTYNADDQRLQRLRVGTSGQLGKWLNLWYTYDLVGNVETVRDWWWVGAVQLK